MATFLDKLLGSAFRAGLSILDLLGLERLLCFQAAIPTVPIGHFEFIYPGQLSRLSLVHIEQLRLDPALVQYLDIMADSVGRQAIGSVGAEMLGNLLLSLTLQIETGQLSQVILALSGGAVWGG